MSPLKFLNEEHWHLGAVLSSYLPRPLRTAAFPILVNAGRQGAERFFDFFTSNIRNANTRAAYLRAVASFFNWLWERKITEFAAVRPIYVAAYIEELQKIRS